MIQHVPFWNKFKFKEIERLLIKLKLRNQIGQQEDMMNNEDKINYLNKIMQDKDELKMLLKKYVY